MFNQTVQFDTLITKIDLLARFIDKDISYFVISLNTKDPIKRKQYRRLSETAHTMVQQLARRFANE